MNMLWKVIHYARIFIICVYKHLARNVLNGSQGSM